MISHVALANSKGLRFGLSVRDFFFPIYISLGNIYFPVLQSFITCCCFFVYSLHYVLSNFSMAGINFGIG